MPIWTLFLIAFQTIFANSQSDENLSVASKNVLLNNPERLSIGSKQKDLAVLSDGTRVPSELALQCPNPNLQYPFPFNPQSRNGEIFLLSEVSTIPTICNAQYDR